MSKEKALKFGARARRAPLRPGAAKHAKRLDRVQTSLPHSPAMKSATKAMASVGLFAILCFWREEREGSIELESSFFLGPLGGGRSREEGV